MRTFDAAFIAASRFATISITALTSGTSGTVMDIVADESLAPDVLGDCFHNLVLKFQYRLANELILLAQCDLRLRLCFLVRSTMHARVWP